MNFIAIHQSSGLKSFFPKLKYQVSLLITFQCRRLGFEYLGNNRKLR